MMKEIKELLKKKAMKGDFMDDNALEAAKKVIGEMDDMADESMAKGMRKVTVASDSEEGMKAGLEKAEEMMEGDDKDYDARDMKPDMEGEMMEEDMTDEMMSGKEKIKDEDYDKTPDYEDMDMEDDMDDDEIDQMIEMLREKKQRREMMR